MVESFPASLNNKDWFSADFLTNEIKFISCAFLGAEDSKATDRTSLSENVVLNTEFLRWFHPTGCKLNRQSLETPVLRGQRTERIK